MTGLEIGASDYVAKPVSPRELLARAGALIELRQSTLALRRRTAELEQSNEVLRATQRALVEAEKLATIGTLVGGVAHELNNPLAFMKSGIETIASLSRDLLDAEASDDTAHELIEISQELAEGIRRLQRIATDLKAFAATQVSTSEALDVEVAIRQAWRQALGKAAQPVELVLDVPAGCKVTTVSSLFHQSLENVLLNALQAIKGPGRVTVIARVKQRNLTLTVLDTGPGIRRDIIHRIFDPFFTTKPPGTATGLGLSVTYGIMQTLRGSIRADTTETGASFTLTLPVDPDEGYNALRAGVH